MQTVKIAYTENTTPCLFNPNSRSGIFNTIRKKDSDSHSNYLFDTYKADGLIVCIVMLKENDANEVKSHTDKLKDERIVVIYPKKAFGQQQSIRKLKGENFSSSFSFFKHIPPD